MVVALLGIRRNGGGREVDTEDDSGPAIGMTGARFGGAPRRRRTARKRTAEAKAISAAAESLDSPDPREADTAAIPVTPPGPVPRPGEPAGAGTHHQGARQHGAPQIGVAQSGTAQSGTAESGTAESGTAESGTAESGTAESGTAESGTAESGTAESGTAQSDGPAPDAGMADGPVVGLTGARFSGAPMRKRGSEPAAGTESAGSRLEPEREAARSVEGPEAATPHVSPPPDEPEPVAGGAAFVRPYVFTRGRTRSSLELSIETLVSAVPQSAPAGLTGEHQVVLDLCREPRSVAELAARAGVPLGVARVLVGDLAAAAAVSVHRSAGEAGPDLALMRRVLSGLRRL
jgi:hypothetical protein